MTAEQEDAPKEDAAGQDGAPGDGGGGGGGQFPQTRWSVVLAARDEGEAVAAAAMEELCSTYWFPLYAYVRRRGHAPADAEDLTQAFFARLIEKEYLRSADQSRGKLRSFLLASLKHFLADEWDKANALKRGGGRTIVSIDQQDAEQRYLVEPADDRSPDREFEKRWALALLESVLAKLGAEYEAAGKGELFAELRKFLTAGADAERHADAAKALGMTENHVRVTVFRLRRRYGDLLRRHIAETVASEADIEGELNHLFEALAEA